MCAFSCARNKGHESGETTRGCSGVWRLNLLMSTAIVTDIFQVGMS